MPNVNVNEQVSRMPRTRARTLFPMYAPLMHFNSLRRWGNSNIAHAAAIAAAAARYGWARAKDKAMTEATPLILNAAKKFGQNKVVLPFLNQVIRNFVR